MNEQIHTTKASDVALLSKVIDQLDKSDTPRHNAIGEALGGLLRLLVTGRVSSEEIFGPDDSDEL